MLKILMFGRGVITLDYGWALEKVGNEIEFYVRPGKATQYGPYVDLDMFDGRKSKKGEKIIEKWAIKMSEEVSPDHNFDLIFVSVNHQQLDEALKKIGTFAGNATILIFNNIWGKLDDISAPLPKNQVVWGFPGAGGGFKEGALKGVLLKSLNLQSVDTAVSSKRHQEVASLFEGAGFTIDYQQEKEGWYWEHFIMDAAFAVESSRAGGFDEIFNLKSIKHLILIYREMLTMIKARGIKLDLKSKMILKTPVGVSAKTMLNMLTADSAVGEGLARIRQSTHTSPEMLAYFSRDVLKTARQLGVNTPLLEELEPNFK